MSLTYLEQHSNDLIVPSIHNSYSSRNLNTVNKLIVCTLIELYGASGFTPRMCVCVCVCVTCNNLDHATRNLPKSLHTNDPIVGITDLIIFFFIDDHIYI